MGTGSLGELSSTGKWWRSSTAAAVSGPLREKRKKRKATLTAGPMADDIPKAAVMNLPKTLVDADERPREDERIARFMKPGLRSKARPDPQPDAMTTAEKHVDRGNQQRRPCTSPYMPPHAKQRRMENERWEKEKAALRQKLEEEDAAGKASFATGRGTGGPNIRTLYRTWEPILEQFGPCCFNPLQRDEGVEVDVKEGIRAKVVARDETSSSRIGPGIKGLPIVAGGSYHYELELLTDSALVMGWSAASSLPTGFDAMSFGYCSSGALLTNHGTKSASYGLPFGRAGDVIGALIEWPEEGSGPNISFMLNGLALGLAYDIASHDETQGHPPLQLHICQSPGPSFDVLLRGASDSAPLRFPHKNFAPLGEIAEEHFCPFSDAVTRAANYRTLATCDAGSLREFLVPDSHVLQVSFDEAASSSVQVERAELELAADIAQLLGVAEGEAPRAVCVRVTSEHTALAAFRTHAHATLSAKVLGSTAVPVCQASRTSLQMLTEWRGARDFRAPRAPTVARRIIHGALGLQLPISHLVQEKEAEARRRGSPDRAEELATTATPSTRSRSSSSAEFVDASV